MEITLTGISQDSKEATITLWHAEEGERVAKGQDLIEVATDKAVFDVPAPCDGVLAGIMKKAGDTARTDEVIAIIRAEKSGRGASFQGSRPADQENPETEA
jgi:pyruvate/2-oxoglutarate dehydrogenase complex dihydrolipoamide acyltransferase (E2) component